MVSTVAIRRSTRAARVRRRSIHLPAAVDRHGRAYDREQDEITRADFYFIDAGEPLDGPLGSLLYSGPNWYSRERAIAIRTEGESKSGAIYGRHFQSIIRCSQHAPADALSKPYEGIARIVTESMQSIDKESLFNGVDDRPFTDDEIRKKVKIRLLSMQGSWTTQHHFSWKVQNSMSDEDCKGRVYMWRPNPDGT